VGRDYYRVLTDTGEVFDIYYPSTRTMTRRTSLACYELKMEFFRA
jgi:hypothetical protein